MSISYIHGSLWSSNCKLVTLWVVYLLIHLHYWFTIIKCLCYILGCWIHFSWHFNKLHFSICHCSKWIVSWPCLTVQCLCNWLVRLAILVQQPLWCLWSLLGHILLCTIQSPPTSGATLPYISMMPSQTIILPFRIPPFFGLFFPIQKESLEKPITQVSRGFMKGKTKKEIPKEKKKIKKGGQGKPLASSCHRSDFTSWISYWTTTK